PEPARHQSRMQSLTDDASASRVAVAATGKLKKGGEGVGERSTSLGPPRPKREDFCRPRAGATPKSNAL
ncbi:MAG: hypothetical protein DWH98_00005, partial [Planctomycetota bacterium]